MKICRSITVALALAWAWAATPAGAATTCTPGNPDDWPMYGHDIHRTGFNGHETKITRATALTLLPKWTLPFHAGDAITASPVVVHFSDFDGKGPRKVIFVGSADAKFHAVDAADGTPIWERDFNPIDPHADEVAYNYFVSSAFVDCTRSPTRLYVGGGFSMLALDAATGSVIWQRSTVFERPDADDPTIIRNYGGAEVETSPVFLEGTNTVYFGSDGDAWSSAVPAANRFPAVFAVNADNGNVRWFWRASRIGTCGDVWGSIAADPDPDVGLLYFATSDCSSGSQGLYNEAVVALPIAPAAESVDAETSERTELPNWYYQPRDIDPYDYDFGSTPILFEKKDAVGNVVGKYLAIGGKDGSFYAMERQRSATAGSFRDLAWTTRVVRGGYAGGFIGAGVSDGQRVYGATALFDIPPGPNPPLQPPYLHAFDPFGSSGTNIAWQQIATGPTFGATTGAPGVLFVGNTAGVVNAVDSETGQVLWVWPVAGAVSSGAAISDGEVFIGSGTTAHSYGLGQGPLNGLNAFALGPLPVVEPPKLPPATWPLGVLTLEDIPGFEDGTTPAQPTPTP